MFRSIIGTKANHHFLLATAIVGAAFVIQLLAYDYGEVKARYRMTKFLKYSAIFPMKMTVKENDYRCILVETVLNDSVSYVTLPLPVVENCKVKRIHQQLTDVALRAHNHLNVASEFMVQSFACITTASIFFIMAGISVAFISKDGITQANPLLITTLICSVAAATFFIGLTSIFKQEKNANDNLSLYLKYANLEQAIRSELVTNKVVLLKSKQACDTLDSSLDATIVSIDRRMAEINDIALGFDATIVKTLGTLDLKGLNESPSP